MKILLPLTCTILVSTYASSAFAENSWYLGAQYSAQEVASSPDRELNTAGIVAGYQFNEFFALETRVNIGTTGYSHQILSDQEYKEDIDTQASLLIKASYPISNGFSIYALAGMSKSKYEITTTSHHTDIDGNTTQTYPHLIKASESGFNYGVGLNYKISEEFSLFVDYQVLPELSIVSGDSSNWNSINIGVNYSF
ncbi:MAG: porin family protein [Colwellia sp.]|nr:porin family protein [Colwellia sp.]